MATGSMPTDTASRYAMGLPTLPETEATAKRQYDETAGEQERAGKRILSREQLAAQGETARDVAQIQADAAIEAARLRQGMVSNQGYGSPRYAKGGPVVDVGYKHSNNPMYAKFASTMDSSLLAKSRGRK